jgi:anti-sigma B factor antagonist
MPQTAIPGREPSAPTCSVSPARTGPVETTAGANAGTVYVTALGGAIDPWMVIALQRRVTSALDAGADRVVLDLTAVTVLGGQTVGVLCAVLRRLARRGARLAVAGGPPHVQRALQLCAIDRLERYPTGDAALMAVRLESIRAAAPASTPDAGSAVPLQAASR